MYTYVKTVYPVLQLFYIFTHCCDSPCRTEGCMNYSMDIYDRLGAARRCGRPQWLRSMSKIPNGMCRHSQHRSLSSISVTLGDEFCSPWVGLRAGFGVCRFLRLGRQFLQWKWAKCGICHGFGDGNRDWRGAQLKFWLTCAVEFPILKQGNFILLQPFSGFCFSYSMIF